MARYFTVLFLSLVVCFASNCTQYGTATTLSGKLTLRDESGYNQFVVLELQQPICTTSDPRSGQKWERGQSGVRVIQAGVYGSDATSALRRDRLDRLVGQRVTIKGVLFPAQTGYHRTDVQLGVDEIRPVDKTGQQALNAPARIEPAPQSISAFDVTVRAGPRLVIEVREIDSKAPLVPSDLYVTRFMTGGEELYVNCRDGYQRTQSSSSEQGGLGCSDGTEMSFCGTSAFPKAPVIIRFRCTKTP